MSNTCKYPECDNPCNSLNGLQCVFHATINEKGVNEKKFNELLSEKITTNNLNFRGYIFPYYIDFSELYSKINGSHGQSIFSDAVFHNGVSFREITFSHPVFFNRTKFRGNKAHFHKTIFKSGASFVEAVFDGCCVFFTGAHFLENDMRFTRTHFGNDVIFSDNQIGCDFNFLDISLNNASRFYFREPKFIIKDNPVRLTFTRIRFNPYAAHFENIRYDKDLQASHLNDIPVFIFRYCVLKDVFFAHNDMSIFSFLDNAYFEEAIYSSNDWYSSKTRKNLIFEDIFFDKLKQSMKFAPILEMTDDPYSVKGLESYRQVSLLYLWLKKSADLAKDYQLASWFYYNEFEMKRSHLTEKIKTEKAIKNKFCSCGRWLLYTLYKYASGYGEKPFWSFAWICVFSTFFSLWYMFRGIKLPSGKIIQYQISFGLPNLKELISDLFYLFLFTFSKIIPVNYIPFDRTKFLTVHDDLFISLANSFILILLIILFGIGLKRHFRRF